MERALLQCCQEASLVASSKNCHGDAFCWPHLETQIVSNFVSLIYSGYCNISVSFSRSLGGFEIFITTDYIYTNTRICPLTFTYVKRAGWYFLAGLSLRRLVPCCSPRIESRCSWPREVSSTGADPTCQNPAAKGHLTRRSWTAASKRIPSALLVGRCFYAAAVEDVLQVLSCSLWMHNGKTQQGVECGACGRHAAFPWLIVPLWQWPEEHFGPQEGWQAFNWAERLHEEIKFGSASAVLGLVSSNLEIQKRFCGSFWLSIKAERRVQQLAVWSGAALLVLWLHWWF